MSLLAASDPVVDWGKLGEVILYSLIGGVGVALCFSLGILGTTRFNEARRSGTGGGALAYALLATLGLAASLAAAVIGIVVMTSKG
jgi:hypothetical protein